MTTLLDSLSHSNFTAAELKQRQSFDLVFSDAVLDDVLRVSRDLEKGCSLVSIARNSQSVMTFAIGSMLGKMCMYDILEDRNMIESDLLSAFDHPDVKLRGSMSFNRRTVIDILRAKKRIPAKTSVKEFKPAGSLPNVQEIIKVLQKYGCADLEQVQSSARSRPIVDTRFVMIWIMRHICGHSLSYIGEQLGGRDHTSILNGVNRIQLIRDKDIGKRKGLDFICDEADFEGIKRHYDILVQQKLRSV